MTTGACLFAACGAFVLLLSGIALTIIVENW